MISQIWFSIWFEKMIQEMNKTERDKLIQELNELSEFEEQNIERMKEIAHILVQDYLHPNINANANWERIEGSYSQDRLYEDVRKDDNLSSDPW